MSRRAALALAGIAGMMLFAVPAEADDVKLTKSAFRYGGTNYYRGKAENVQLCSFGDKKTPVGQVNYLAVEGNVSNANLAKVNVRMAGPFDIDWSKFSKTDVEGGVGLKFFKVGGAKGSFSHESAKSANLKLVKFYLDGAPLKRLLNSYAGAARSSLKSEGGSGRIVSEVWVVMEGQLASQVTSSGSVSGSGSGNGVEVEFKASTSSTTTTKINIAPDTTFAYLLHKVRRWKGTQVEDLEDDQHGMF